MTMQQITTFLMFEGKAEEAMNLYLSLFKQSEIRSITRYGANVTGAEGTVQQAVFALNGQEFMCIDSSIQHQFTFTPSMSLFVTCAAEEEIDQLYIGLSQGGEVLMPLAPYPFSEKYGWVSDKFGVSWQLSLVKMSEDIPKRDIVITRVFNAPIELVWRAWTDPEHVMQWWGPDHFTSPSAQIDFCEGGISLVCMRAPKEFGGQDMYSTWAYTKIVPLQRIEYIHNLADKNGKKADPVQMGMPADFPQDQRHVVTFKTLSDNQTELTVTEYGWAVGHMMEMSQLGMEQCLDKMAASFAIG